MQHSIKSDDQLKLINMMSVLRKEWSLKQQVDSLQTDYCCRVYKHAVMQ